MNNTHKAVFLDRDGVINELILNPDTGQYESPNEPGDFVPCPKAAEALRLLQDHKYLLIVISNQPSHAKGKTTHENLELVDQKLSEWCEQENIRLTERYYCYHHPEAVVPELKQECRCRKPGTLFPEHAEQEFDIDLGKSWFIGDRATDIECGKNCGCHTIIVKSHETVDTSKAGADHQAEDILKAARVIIGQIK